MWSKVLSDTVHFLLYFEGKRRISSKKERRKRRKGKKQISRETSARFQGRVDLENQSGMI